MRAVIEWDEITTGTATETFAQLLAAANRPIYITEVSITFKGVDNLGTPIRVELLRQTTAGTATARTIRKVDERDGQTIQTTGQIVFTAEPTASDVLRTWLVHPQGGVIYPVPDPSDFTVAGGNRIGLRVVTPAVAVNCVGYIEFRE